MFYPPLSNSQMVQLIQLANINAAALKYSLSQINDPKEQRRLRDDVELLESTAEGLSEILGLVDDTPPSTSTITPKFTDVQTMVVLDAIAEHIDELESREKNVEDEETFRMLRRKICALKRATDTIRNEL